MTKKDLRWQDGRWQLNSEIQKADGQLLIYFRAEKAEIYVSQGRWGRLYQEMEKGLGTRSIRSPYRQGEALGKNRRNGEKFTQEEVTTLHSGNYFIPNDKVHSYNYWTKEVRDSETSITAKGGGEEQITPKQGVKVYL